MGRSARQQARRREMIAANVDRLCPPDHKHEATATCWNSHGCRCEPCCEARRARRRRDDKATNFLRGRDVWLPSVGAQRRLQALAVMGWSPAVIAERMGSHYRPLLKIRAGERQYVRLSTHRRIAAVFSELGMVEAPGHSGVLQRAFAKRRGWVSALAWDDIDNPADRALRAARCSVPGCFVSARGGALPAFCSEHSEEAA